MKATSAKTKFHRDGTVTYWSVYRQQWIERAEQVPDRELAAMSWPERSLVINHLTKGRRQDDDISADD